jgi:hypothetical protein
MGTAELVEQVKALPARERRRFVEIILALEDDSTATPTSTRRIKWPDIEARSKRIFGNKTLPNLVLMEREEASS